MVLQSSYKNDLETIKSKTQLIHEVLLNSLNSYKEAIVHHKNSKWVVISNVDFVIIVNQIAFYLLKSGVKQGDRVLIAGFSCWQWLAAELAVLKVGAVVVGLDPFVEKSQFDYICNELNPTVLITSTNDVTLKWNVSFEKIQTILWQQRHLNLFTKSNDDMTSSINQFPDVTADQIASIVYTSGTTGKPKGIPYTHEQIYQAVSLIRLRFPELLHTQERFVSWLPLAHLFQRMLNYCAVVQGGQLFFQDDPRVISEVIVEIKPSIMIGVPKFFEKFQEGICDNISKKNKTVRLLFKNAIENAKLILKMKSENKKISKSTIIKKKIYDRLILNKIRSAFGGNMKLWLSGSAPLSRDTLSFYEALGYPIFEAYGVSENIIPNAMNCYSDYRPLSVGKPMPDQEIIIAEDKEILIKGPGVIKQYINNDLHVVDENGFYHTGDLGHFDSDGYLYIEGRKSDYIKLSNGHKVFPVNIEALLNRSKSIEQSFVCGIGRSKLVALIYPADNSIDELRQSVRMQAAIDQINQSVNRHEVIVGFHLLSKPFGLESKEMTSTMKLRRKQIESNYQLIIESIYQNELQGV